MHAGAAAKRIFTAIPEATFLLWIERPRDNRARAVELPSKRSAIWGDPAISALPVKLNPEALPFLYRRMFLRETDFFDFGQLFKKESPASGIPLKPDSIIYTMDNFQGRETGSTY